MTKILGLMFCAYMLICTGSVFAQKTITIKGNVQFPYNRFNMEIYERQGFDKIVLDSCKVNEDGSYEFKMNVDKPGVYTLDCQKWQSVNFWAEDEDLVIHFRGEDTAKMKIKNPPYVYINGGPNNEVINLMNWDGYRGYQLMIGVSQGVYRIPGLDDQAKQDASMKFYDVVREESQARIKYLAEHYADRNSILAVLPRLTDEDLINKVLARLEAQNPDYAPLLKYKADRAEKKAQQERLAEGKPAPEFSFPTPDGKKALGPQDFKGKFLVLDFWASWCGPCRQEIPNLKKDYEEFKDKGVVFLSVSIDKDDAAWRKAMKEENMPWAQALAPKAGKEVMKQYQFSGIPYILVIDKEGRIIGKNLRGKALTDKLTELVSGKKKESVAMPAMGM